MLCYAEVDFSPPPVRMVQRRQVYETSECNYLLMFFILGVFFMAITDSLTK